MKKTTIYILWVLGVILCSNNIASGDNIGSGRRLVSSKSLRSMARVYMAYGEYKKAQPLIEQALASARKTNASDNELAMCLIDEACLYKGQNRLSDAEKICREGLELQKESLYKDHPYIAYTLRILYSIYYEQGKIYEAKRALDKATNIMLRNHAEDDYVMISLQVDRAKLFASQGKLTEAETSYCNALSIINKHNPNHLYKATVLENIAELYLMQGKYAEAELQIDQAISMREKFYGLEHHFLVPALFIKASIEQEKGNHTASEDFINKALVAVKTTENISKIIEVQRRAEEIRANKFMQDKLVAKAVPSESIANSLVK